MSGHKLASLLFVHLLLHLQIALGGICLPRMCHLVNKFISLAVLRPELSRKSNTTWPVGRVSIRLQLGGQLLKAPGEIER